MCGRCTTLTFEEVLEAIQELETGARLHVNADAPRREAYPRSLAPLIVPTFDTAAPAATLGPGSLMAQELTWGFDQSWKPGLIFNTRIESAERPMWADSMLHRRCVIPVTAFYETHATETVTSARTGRAIKAAYRFLVPGSPVVLIGGIWRGERFSMVTTEANADMAPVHARMPLILRPHEVDTWLSSDFMSLADRSEIPLVAERAS